MSVPGAVPPANAGAEHIIAIEIVEQAASSLSVLVIA
jgi:hypothetical protein